MGVLRVQGQMCTRRAQRAARRVQLVLGHRGHRQGRMGRTAGLLGVRPKSFSTGLEGPVPDLQPSYTELSIPPWVTRVEEDFRLEN